MNQRQLWAAAGKSIHLQGITAQDGTALTSNAAAEALAQHWGQIFSCRPGDPEKFESFKPFVQVAPADIDWSVSLLEVESLLSRIKNSAPGPDGLKYKVYQTTSEISATIIHDVYMAMARGAVPPPWFNDATLAFSAKGEEADEYAMVLRTPLLRDHYRWQTLHRSLWPSSWTKPWRGSLPRQSYPYNVGS